MSVPDSPVWLLWRWRINDEYIRKLRELEKAEAAAMGKRDDVPIV